MLGKDFLFKVVKLNKKEKSGTVHAASCWKKENRKN